MSSVVVAAIALLASVALFIFTGYAGSFLETHISENAARAAAEAADRPKERPPILDTIGRPFKGKVPPSISQKAEQLILYAGHPYDLRPEDVCGLMVVGFIAAGWFGAMLANLMDFSFLIAIPVGLLGAGFPWLWLRDLVMVSDLT